MHWKDCFKESVLTNIGADSAHGNNLVILEAKARGQGDGGGGEDNEGLHDDVADKEWLDNRGDTTMTLYTSGHPQVCTILYTPKKKIKYECLWKKWWEYEK